MAICFHKMISPRDVLSRGVCVLRHTRAHQKKMLCNGRAGHASMAEPRRGEPGASSSPSAAFIQPEHKQGERCHPFFLTDEPYFMQRRALTQQWLHPEALAACCLNWDPKEQLTLGPSCMHPPYGWRSIWPGGGRCMGIISFRPLLRMPVRQGWLCLCREDVASVVAAAAVHRWQPEQQQPPSPVSLTLSLIRGNPGSPPSDWEAEFRRFQQ